MKLYCIIPNYNYCNVKALNILNQTSQPNETIIVEDDSGIESISYAGRITRWMRKERNYASKNIWDAVKELERRNTLSKSDLIVLIDGDDSLLHRDSFLIVRKYHHLEKCWLSYGSYVNKSDMLNGAVSKTRRGPYKSGESVRTAPWRASHIKAFRYGLFKHLNESHFKDADGNWLKMCSDLALMFPMMEMAGWDRIRHIDKPLYIYNDMNDMNDHKVDGAMQKEIEKYLRGLPVEKRIATLKVV